MSSLTVEPAHVDQIRAAQDGRMVAIDADVGGVAAELARIDPGLHVRFAENASPPAWIVVHVSHPDCVRNGDVGEHGEYLVTTRSAWQNHAGVWEGLTHELVDHLRRIDPAGRGGYDYALEVQRQNERAEAGKRQRALERFGEDGERLAFALRKDFGFKGRTFVPRDVA